MGKVKIFYDKTANSLVVWFDDPVKEYVATEVEDDTVLMKERSGKVIGLEKLNYLPSDQKHPAKLPIEVVAAK